jgi:hypothetical protein
MMNLSLLPMYKLTHWVPDFVTIEHFQMSPNPPLPTVRNLPLVMSVAGIGIGSNPILKLTSFCQ